MFVDRDEVETYALSWTSTAAVFCDISHIVIQAVILISLVHEVSRISELYRIFIMSNVYPPDHSINWGFTSQISTLKITLMSDRKADFFILSGSPVRPQKKASCHFAFPF